MTSPYTYLDAAGKHLFPGARFVLVGEHAVDEAVGVVDRIEDPDLDQHARAFLCFDDGEEDDFPLMPRFPNDDLICEDIVVTGCSRCDGSGMVPVGTAGAARYSRLRDPDGVNAPEMVDCVCH